MTAALRSWLGFLALAAGLVHVALSVGSPPAVAAVLLLVGAAEFGWGAFAIARPTPPIPQVARGVALLPVVGWALLLVVAGADSLGPLTSSVQLLPMLVASLFDLLVSAGLTLMLRRAGRADDDHPTRRLVAVILGGIVIAAVTAPALAATEAARYVAVPSTSVFGTPGHDH